MISENIRNDIWQRYLDCGRLVRYYEKQSDQHRRKNVLIKFLILLSIAAGLVSLIDALPDEGQTIAGAVVSALVAWDFVSNHSRKSAVLDIVSVECAGLEIEWENLWSEIEDEIIESVEARRRNKELSKRLMEITSLTVYSQVKRDENLNEKSAQDAYTAIGDRYGQEDRQ